MLCKEISNLFACPNFKYTFTTLQASDSSESHPVFTVLVMVPVSLSVSYS